MPLATGETKEWCRHSSRACTLEMCSSITGTEAPPMASCSAADVWVNAPGLNTAPIDVPAFTAAPHSWIQSISWPSWLDCRKSTSSPSLPPSARQRSATSARVVVPYTSGLRVPSRLRFGPFRTSTEDMAPRSWERPRRRLSGGAAGGSHGRAHPLVLLCRHRGGVRRAEIVQVDPEGLAGAERRDGGDDRAPEGERADDQRNVRAGSGHRGGGGRQERGDRGADVLRDGEAGDARLGREQFLV